MSEFGRHPDWRSRGGWRGVSSTNDHNDELIGDIVEEVSLETASFTDAVLVGEPFDDAVIGRTGASQGPVAIREALAGVTTHHFETGALGRLGDLGDIASLLDGLGRDRGHFESVESVQTRLQGTTASVHDCDTLPIFLGGDNSLTYPNVAPLLYEGSVGVINLDAHLDVRAVDGEPTSGTPYRQLLEEGLDAYACVGPRHFETSTRYHEYAREHGVEIVTAEAVGDDPTAATQTALEAMDDVEMVYLSVDCDVLDATAAPGVSAPTPGGITARELFTVLRRVAADDRLVGFEVVECAPPLDRAERTASVAARAVAHVVAGAHHSSR